MALTGESLSLSLARRTLMQRYEGPDQDGADDVAAQLLASRVVALSKDGATTQIDQVTQALIGQQVLAAEDVRQLWPDAPQMQIAAAQMTAKANAFHLGGGLSEVALPSESPRQRETG